MKKRLKRGTKVMCVSNTEGYTVGKIYKVLGNAPLNRLIIKADNGKRNFPSANGFKKVTFLMKLNMLWKRLTH